MRASRRNLELKVCGRRPGEVAEGLRMPAGRGQWNPLFQRTPTSMSPKGRLKLRRETGAAAHLIAYERPDLPRQRESRYRIVEIGDAPGLEETLAGILGVTVVVSKERRLFLFEGVRIHLDRVDGLGSFIELRGSRCAPASHSPRLGVLLTRLRNSLGIDEADLIGESYCDLSKRLEPAGQAHRRARVADQQLRLRRCRRPAPCRR